MRCLYREKRFLCGEFLEVDVFPVFKKPGARCKRAKPTTAVQERLNQRNAERKLIRLLNANFTEEDIRFDLTYNKDNYPDSPEQAQKEVQNFLRRVKRLRKKLDLPELKYVFVTEIGQNDGRLHHHIVMSGGMSINKLARLWGKGYTTAKPLQFDEFGIVGIAVYLVKNPILGKRWCASRNLEHPKESQRDGRLSQRDVRDLAVSPNDAKKKIEKYYVGYLLSDMHPYYNDVNGGWYLCIRMRRRPPKKTTKKGNSP